MLVVVAAKLVVMVVSGMVLQKNLVVHILALVVVLVL